jgi:hypothetical protein
MLSIKRVNFKIYIELIISINCLRFNPLISLSGTATNICTDIHGLAVAPASAFLSPV